MKTGDAKKPPGDSSPTAPPAMFQLRLTFDKIRNHHFTGRESTLLELHRMLWLSPRQDMLSVVVLCGVGGVGKTQIALEHAYRSRNDYDSIFWIDGSREDTLVTSVKQCLETIWHHYITHSLEHTPQFRYINATLYASSSKVEAKQQKLKEGFKEWLSYEDNRSWLIILDNVDDLESYNFRDILPSTTWGAVLLTSRRTDLAASWDSIVVGDMENNEALALLQESTGILLEEETDGL